MILEFPFSLFPTDLKATQNVALDVFRNPPGAHFQIESITTAGVPLPGDYNRDGVVNGDDYLVWRSYFGVNTAQNTLHPLASADGNGDGQVDAADYTIWRDHLTSPPGSASGETRQVPEPASLVPALVAVFALVACRLQWRRITRLN